MAFVYRKKKNQQQKNPNQTPGPGEYNTITPTVFNKSAVSFVDKVPRKLWRQNAVTPGPGQYNISSDANFIQGNQILSGGKDENFCVIESSSHKNRGTSYGFKSKSKRLAISSNQTPGPGQYQINDKNQKRQAGVQFVKHKQNKITRYLNEQTKKQKKCIGELSINQRQIAKELVGKIHQKQLDNQSNLHKNQYEKNNYKSVFNSRVSRQIVVRPQTATQVGPGSYNINQFYQNQNRKSYNQKTNVQNLIYRQGQQKQNNKKEIGPGYYQIQTSSFVRPTTSLSKGIPCFGSKQSRFTQQLSQTKTIYIQPGPQTYFPGQKKPKKQNQKKKTVGFNSRQQKTSTNFTQISPCSYYPQNDFNNLLKKNFVKGSIGNFGSTVQRFKQNSVNKDNIPLQINNQLHLRAQGQEQQIKPSQKLTYSFKNVRKNPLNKNKANKSSSNCRNMEIFDNRQFYYDTNSFTIGSKYINKKQIQAPFLTGSQRFHSQKINYQQRILNEIKTRQQNIIVTTRKQPNDRNKLSKAKMIKTGYKNQISSVMKKFKENVCKLAIYNKDNEKNNDQDKQHGIGPQTYQPNLIENKKSFNRLFNQ